MVFQFVVQVKNKLYSSVQACNSDNPEQAESTRNFYSVPRTTTATNLYLFPGPVTAICLESSQYSFHCLLVKTPEQNRYLHL